MSEWEVPAGPPGGDEWRRDEVEESLEQEARRLRDPDWQQKREAASAAVRELRSSVTPFDGSDLFVRGPDGRLQ